MRRSRFFSQCFSGRTGPKLFSGTFEYSALRKIKVVDINLILVPIESAPGPLAEIIAAGATDKDGLMVFAGSASKEGGASRKKHE